MGSKVTELTELSAPTVDDLMYIVDNPGGSATSNKISLTRLFGLLNGLQGFRLTLASGQPVFAPQAATPASTDTGQETTTFSVAHGWANGTIVTPATTVGGLTAGTRYYINVVSATTVSYHTTVADAMLGTNKVNLTANVTAQIVPSGISATNLYFTPYKSKLIALYDGTRWKLYSNAEISLALGTLTSGKNYDVFCYDNAGVLTLELLVWTDDTNRATAIALQDGIPVKTGATTRRLVGTIRTDSTTTTIDDGGGLASVVGGKRFVAQADNETRFGMTVWDSTSSWTTNNTTGQQVRAQTGNKCEVVVCLTPRSFDARTVAIVAGTTTTAGMSGVQLDATTGFRPDALRSYSGAANAGNTTITGSLVGSIGPGYHQICWMEATAASVTTFVGAVNAAQSGMVVTVYC